MMTDKECFDINQKAIEGVERHAAEGMCLKDIATMACMMVGICEARNSQEPIKPGLLRALAGVIIASFNLEVIEIEERSQKENKDVRSA